VPGGPVPDDDQNPFAAIVEAPISNSQVYWIAKDSDINQFLRALVEGREDMIEAENLPRIRYNIDELKEYEELPPDLRP